MGFNDARTALISALHAVQSGERALLHEPRDEPDKNQLARGHRSLNDVIEMAKKATGGQGGANYRSSPHHTPARAGVIVHELRNIQWRGGNWYVKWFFDDDDVWFISVHQ